MTNAPEQMKKIIKEALMEVLTERPDLFMRLVEDALENVALVSAIQLGDESPLIERNEILDFFGGKL